MSPSKLVNLLGSAPRRLACAAIVAASVAAPANAAADWSVRVCYMGENFSIWVEVVFANISGGYDPMTHAGVVDYNTSGPFNPGDFFFLDVPDGTGGLVSFQGGQDMVMGTYEVFSGLGTATVDASFFNIWIIVDDWHFHLFPGPIPPIASLSLTGFTPQGEGTYLATGLDIPVQFEVVRPDGTAEMIQRTVTTLELRTPLALTPPECLADLNNDTILDLSDINAFVQGFLGGCD